MTIRDAIKAARASSGDELRDLQLHWERYRGSTTASSRLADAETATSDPGAIAERALVAMGVDAESDCAARDYPGDATSKVRGVLRDDRAGRPAAGWIA